MLALSISPSLDWAGPNLNLNLNLNLWHLGEVSLVSLASQVR